MSNVDQGNTSSGAVLHGDVPTLPLEPFLLRLNRHLRKLMPYRELIYDRTAKDYFVRIMSTGPDHLRRQGPYYYNHMIGLARHINALSMIERAMPAITLKSRNGNLYEEHKLSGHLKFDVLTPVLYDAICQLRERGYDVTKRAAPVTAPASVTSAVTEPEVTDPAEEYDETLGFDIDPETGEVTAR